jgi:hypothetical protein
MQFFRIKSAVFINSPRFSALRSNAAKFASCLNKASLTQRQGSIYTRTNHYVFVRYVGQYRCIDLGIKDVLIKH